ncbi:MAG: glutamyl-tRNA reductase [Saprospiraceae bacterium]|jgi:glutamyl-tRNA reductase
MLNYFKLITVTHKNLDTEELSHFVIRHENENELVDKLQAIKEDFKQDEIFYLATCNRIVILLFGHHSIDKESAIDLFLHINPELQYGEHLNLAKVISHHVGLTAINHLLEVTSSIDSLVVGEREIFRQFRDAYKFCSSKGLCGDNMRILQQSAVKASKAVYTKTGIGTKPVSVASLAIQEFLKRNLDKSAKILLIGAGETNTKIGRFLKKHEYTNLVIFNRSLNNARELSEELNAEAQYLTDLENYVDPFEAIFAATSSQEALITPALWSKINPHQEVKTIIDLSIPHNVSPQVNALPSVDYISIDSIRQIAEENLVFRNSNIASARAILREYLDEFTNLFERRKVERAFKKLPNEIKEIKHRALDLIYKDQIATLPPETQALISEIASYMEKKCVAAPIKLAKQLI